MQVKPVRTRLFKLKEALFPFIIEHIKRPKEGTVIVVTSKILALAQGRVVALKNPKDKERWIRRESRATIRTPWCWITLTNGEWCANAGVDESNADGSLILLPKNIEAETIQLLKKLKRHYRRKQLGLLVTDTRIYPLRTGTMGAALGYAGFQPLKNYIGEQDLFGRHLKMTQTNVVQALAVSAVLVMGEGKERQPLALIQDAPVEFTDRKTPTIKSLAIDPCGDVYRSVYDACPVKQVRHPVLLVSDEAFIK